ncbi:MAG: Type 1 glutamine amidotransferase-like domain-containing protein [Candidatus Paceibacterota bacterium]
MKSKKDNKSNIERKIIPIGGGLLRLDETITIDKFIVKESGKKNPKVLFIPTASKDLLAYSNVFRRVYEKLGCQVKILRLFNKRKFSQTTLEKLITSADIIYVGGGDYDILLSMWRKHKIISLIRLAYQQGTILTGLSAGCAVWYEYLIDSDKDKKTRLKKGLGILEGVVIPHYRTEDPLSLEIRKTKIIVTGIEDKCAVIYTNEHLRGSIPASKEKAFTIRPPYVKKKQVTLYFHKSH